MFNLLILNPSSVLATNPEPLKWTKVNIPAQGSAGGWVLANHSDIKCLTAAPDGTLYASVAGLANTLYKSTDGVKRWSPVGDVHDDIIDIAVSPNGAKTIYYATATSIFRSSDGGKNFLRLPSVPTRSGASITSIDVSWLNNNVIAVGTADANSAEFGGVYTLEEAEIFPGWADTNIGNYDVFAVDFSPDYITGQQIVAVVSDEIATFVFNKIGNADWNAFIGPARLNKNNANPPAGIVPSQAAIAFPGSYQTYASSFFFVGINTGVGEGDVYKITCADAPNNSWAADLNCGGIYGAPNTDVSSLAVYSDSQHDLLLAGSSIGSQIYISQDWGASWNNSSKQPTGNAVTGIVFSPDFATTNEIYAATSGNGSAISISRDIGLTWNQISLIDTIISTIVDFVPSPVSSEINAMFLITFALGSVQSLWRSLDDAVSWERILCSDSPGVDVLSLVTLPPEYSSDCLTLFIYGESNHTPAIWNSEDNGQSFRCSITRAPSGSTPFSVHAWAVANKNAVYLGGDDGTIYLMTASGYNYLKRGSAGDSQPYSLALSPDFVNDGNLLVGNFEGEVFWSSDGGSSFQSLPADISSPPLDGAVSVAFDPNYKTNHTVYAAGAASNNGIYRFIIGSSEVWESIHTTLPAGASINRLAVSADGVLYAANSNADGGMERCLNPRFSLTPVFESVTRGLNDGATLSGLWQRHNQLWAIDLINVKLMSFNDTLTSPVILVAPNDNSTGIGALSAHTVKDITIDWDSMSGITDYAWQCSYDTDFSTIPDGLSGTTSASSVRLPPLESATTYYWRVRASSPVFSPWSAKWTFTTTMDTETINLELESPLPGATAVSIKPVFQWTAILGAEAYELLVATDDDFINPVIIKIGEYALKTNAWNCDIALYFDTVYYWKIRAVTASTSSAWSSVGIFNTELLPNETPTLPTRQPELLTVLSTPKLVPSTAPSTTAASQLFDMPAWIIYLFAGLFCIVFLSLLIVLIIVIKIKSL